MTARAITGGPPPDGIWERIQRFVRTHDPRSGWAFFYAAFGLALGFSMGGLR